MPTMKLAFDRTARRIDADGRSGVYAITTPSGSRYVGSAVNFDKRWARHLTYLRSGKHHNAPLQRAFEKYGESGLSFAPILVCDKPLLLMYEQIAINAIVPEYNVCRVAGSHLGIKRSAETSARMSDAQRKRAPPTAETLLKMGAAKRGMKRSEKSKTQTSAALRVFYSNPENVAKRSALSKVTNARPDVRAKISEALKGAKRSEETRAKMSAAQKGHVSTLKGIPRSAEVKAKISATRLLNLARKRDADK